MRFDDGSLLAGEHSAEWSGEDLESWAPASAASGFRARKAVEWEKVFRQLQLVSQKAEFMTLRVDDEELRIVVGQSDEFTNPAKSKRYLSYIGRLAVEAGRVVSHQRNPIRR